MGKRDADSGTGLSRVRLRIFNLLEPAAPADFWSKFVDGVLVFLILANVLLFVLDSVPEVQARYGNAFLLFTIASGVIFTAEYGLRVWSSVEVLHGKDTTYLERRVRFMLRPVQIVDLVVIMSFWLIAFIPYDLRALRIIRILSFVRMVRYSPAMVALLAVFKTERRSLASSCCILLATIVVAGSVMYYLEREHQPEAFSDIPTAIYWAATTVSTVGYGDLSPVTPAGRFFGTIVMFLGVGFGAILIGIISVSFSVQANQRDFISTWTHITKIPIFTRLEIDGLKTVTGAMETVTLPAGDVLFDIGAPLDRLVLVQEGELLVEGDTWRSLLGRSSFFGELSLLGDRRTKAKITAEKNAKLLVLTRESFENLLKTHKEIRAAVEAIARYIKDDERLITEQTAA